MFRFTQEPSLGNSPVLSQSYKVVFFVLVSMDAVIVMAAYQSENRTPAWQAEMPP